MNHERSEMITEALVGASPEPPKSEPPSVSDLNDRLQHRVVAKRRQRRTGIACVLAVVSATAFMALNRDDPNRQIAADDQRDVIEADATPVEMNAENASSDGQAIRVLATVGQPVPVFDLDEESQIVRHVGWIETRQTVALDVQQLSKPYRELLEAKLNSQDSNPSTQYISL